MKHSIIAPVFTFLVIFSALTVGSSYSAKRPLSFIRSEQWNRMETLTVNSPIFRRLENKIAYEDVPGKIGAFSDNKVREKFIMHVRGILYQKNPIPPVRGLDFIDYSAVDIVLEDFLTTGKYQKLLEALKDIQIREQNRRFLR